MGRLDRFREWSERDLEMFIKTLMNSGHCCKQHGQAHYA